MQVKRFFLAVVIFLNLSSESPNELPEFKEIFQYIVPIWAALAILIGQLVFKSVISSLKTKDTYIGQLGVFQTASLIKWAFLEGASLFAIVSYFLTGGWFFVVISVSLMAIQIFDRPTQAKIDQHITIKENPVF